MFNYKKFINEKKKQKDRIIYFLHPKITYNESVESQSLELINLYFDSPLVYNVPKRRGKFYSFADELNTVIVLPFTNSTISPRMWRHLVYAFEKGFDIYYIHPRKYKIIKIEDIEFFEEKAIDKETWNEIKHDDDIELYFSEVEE